MPAVPGLPSLYGDLAHLWPALSPVDHYLPEAAVLRHLLRARLATARPRLLELGAGGGHVIHHLQDEYEITAVDLSEPMLENCRRLNPDIPCIAGDMRSVRLGQRFDAVLLHDAIDYMQTEADVRAAMDTAAAHLDPGGLVVCAPTYVRDDFIDGDSSGDTGSTDDLDLTYVTYVHDPDPADTTFEMILVYIIRDRRTRQVEVVEDRHQCGLFSRQRWLELLEASGFRAAGWEPPETVEGFEPPSWSLFLAEKR